MSRKILFIDATHPILRDELIKLGFECEFFPDYSRNDFDKIIGDYYGIIIRSKIKIDKNIIDRAKKLKFIGRVGSGLESINEDYANSKGISCLNSPEGNRDAVGEHVIGMLLNLMNKISPADKQVRQGIWEREGNRGIELKGKTFGIIGYGNMGSSVAKKLKGFEANVIAYDKYKMDYSDENVREVTLEELFDASDIVSLHVPLTEETKYMVNDTFINSFMKNIYLINSSRGIVVNTSDLVKNMKSGKVLAAALDVLEYEDTSFEKITLPLTPPQMEKGKGGVPDPFQYLINADNVILTPHIAGWTTESKYKLSMVLVEKIKDLIKPE
jgi:D-3-phosphoglycerate dehydrogenase / 2-oxoglutarate reductase